jgi:cellulose synthase/poly-beta-1,6-N-acetylglucosamine synthase-like glycosyltransferase
MKKLTRMKTIGIPTYNEEKSIVKTIKSILLELDLKDEIIVVASGCTDKTIDVVNQIDDPKIRVIEQKERKGKVSAVNIILSKAQNEIVVLADADIIPSVGAIRRLVKNLDDPKVGASCAKVENYQRKTLLDKIQEFGWEALNDQKIEENKKGTFYALNGYLAAVKKNIIKNLNESYLLDDALLGFEIKKKGYKIIYDPTAKAFVKAAQNLRDYINQKARNRLGWWQMTKKGMKISERRNVGQLKYLLKRVYAWPYITLDFVIWLKAYIDFRKGKSYWKEIRSSKI